MKAWLACAAVAAGCGLLPDVACAALDCARYADDLRQMAEVDQALRLRWPADPFPKGAKSEADLPESVRLTITADRVNTRRLKAWVEACGWPSRQGQGDKAVFDAWLLVQHSPDEAFQRSVLTRLQAERASGVPPFQQAYLADRLATKEHEPQRYGTQLAMRGPCDFEFEPMDDRAKVEARRRAIGLPPLDEYRQQVLQSMPGCHAP